MQLRSGKIINTNITFTPRKVTTPTPTYTPTLAISVPTLTLPVLSPMKPMVLYTELDGDYTIEPVDAEYPEIQPQEPYIYKHTKHKPPKYKHKETKHRETIKVKHKENRFKYKESNHNKLVQTRESIEKKKTFNKRCITYDRKSKFWFNNSMFLVVCCCLMLPVV